MNLNIRRLTGHAKLPTRGSVGAAGHDLYASNCDAIVISKGSRALVPTGISMEIPVGYYGRVAPRSGLAVNSGINVGAGVIDSDYRGEVKVLLFNHSDHEFMVEPGMRIAQLILEKCANHVEIVLVNEFETDTERGEGGFGSTGM